MQDYLVRPFLKVMASFVFLTLALLAASCQSNADTQVQLPPDISVSASDTSLRNANGTFMWKGQKFDGYIIVEKDSVVLEKMPVIAGKQHGTGLGWYPKGKKKYERNFLNGDREGIERGWYENGQLSHEFFFKNDKYEGPQKTYYENGNRWQELNYVNGYEEGKQKMWSDSGRVVNNFTVKNGKLYGVVGRYDCMSVIKK